MKVFLDTSIFVAYFLKQEASHDDVLLKYSFYRHKKATFFTSNYILDELFTWFNVKQNKNILETIIYAIEKIENVGEIKVFYIDKGIDKKARSNLLRFSDHKISFTDMTTYVIYKDFKLNEIFTLDSDFKKIGANTSF